MLPGSTKAHNGLDSYKKSPKALQGGSFRRPRSALGTVILNFTPSWFSVNMGTGILSILLYLCPHSFRGLHHIAWAFYLLNIALFLTFSGLSLARHILFPWVFWRMLKYPAVCFFLGAVPMGLVTIINATVLMVVPAFGHWAVILVQVLWWIDVAMTLLCTFAIPILMFHIHELALESMTAIWLLPIVPAVVAAASGGVVATVVSAASASLILVVSYMLWGIGMGLSMIVLVLYFHRLAVHNLPNAEVIVSAFLPLGPLGQGAYAIMQLGRVCRDLHPVVHLADAQLAGADIWVVSVLVGIALWGLGWWWLAHGVSSVLIRYLQGRIAFSMGFWGFIFPLGVFTSATILLSQALPSAFLSWLAVALIIVLVLLWVLIAVGTVVNAKNGSLFVAPCLQTAPSKDSSWVEQDDTSSEEC